MPVSQSLRCLVAGSSFLLMGVLSGAGVRAESPTIETIVTWLEGPYSNARQIEAGDLNAESDLLFPVFKQVDIPAFGDSVVYLQWPIGRPDGRLQRQRIWTFENDPATGAVRMNFYTLKEPDLWLDAHREPEKVRTMGPEDVIGYPEGCLLPVTMDDGLIRASIPSTCVIVSQSTRTTMTLESTITIGPDRVTYKEGGIRPDGTVVFTVPAQGRYVFDKSEN